MEKQRNRPEYDSIDNAFSPKSTAVIIGLALGTAVVASWTGGTNGEGSMPDSNYPLPNDHEIEMATAVASTPATDPADIDRFLSGEIIFTADGTEIYIQGDSESGE